MLTDFQNSFTDSAVNV